MEARSRKTADAILHGPDANIVLLFGGGHGPSIFANLQAIDPRWKRTK